MAEKEPEVAALLARAYIGMSKSTLFLTQRSQRRGEERTQEY
jgi:hypothetical protein